MKAVRLALLLPLCLGMAATAQEPVEFSGLTWSARGEWRLAEHLGRPAVLMRNAVLELQDVWFNNGTIEFEVAASGHRSFTGVAFRKRNGSYEDFYLRPHQSNRFDALQYTPVWNDASAWQLYPEHNAAFDIPRDAWLTVKLVVRDGRLEAFLGGGYEPALVVGRLRGPQKQGRIALRSFFPDADRMPDFYPNAFTGFRFTPDDSYRRTEPEIESGDARIIDRWALSQAFPGTPEQIEAYPTELVAKAEWIGIDSEPTGRTNLAITGGVPASEDLRLKLARVVLTSDRERDLKLNYGFSDRVSIFLNGRLLLTSDNTYRSRSLRYLGVMTLENDAIVLPLEKGDNELLFAVTEAFGGWGLTARLGALDGVRWRPTPPTVEQP